MKYETFTELNLIKESEQVQNASNILGIVNSYNEALKQLRVVTGLGSDDLAKHIVSKNFASKINDLAGNF